MAIVNALTVPAITGDIPVNFKASRGGRYLFVSRDQRAYTHAIHKYPAKFFPELPRWFIEKFSGEGDIVVDPFCGSGTTNLEALLLGRNSVGIDVDPFSRFIAKVKTTIIKEKSLLCAVDEMTNIVSSYQENKKYPSPFFPYKDRWFKPYIINELAFLKESIDNLPVSASCRGFLLVVFSSVIRAASQAENNCTRTVIRKSRPKEVRQGYALSLFLKRLENAKNGMLELANRSINSAVKIPAVCDAKNLKIYSDNYFDLAVTSPPYLNAVDYPRTHQLEMYWLGMENGSLKNLKRKHIGTEVVTANDYSQLHKTESKSANKTIESIYKVDKRRACIASMFVNDMDANLSEVYRTIKDGARYVIVIGNNSVRGHVFENWRYMAELAKNIGYKVENTFQSAIINHFIKFSRKERIEEDHILILKK